MSVITIDVKPMVEEPSETVAMAASAAAPDGQVAGMDAVFELDGVSIHYGTFRAVRDISLRIPRHQISALIGPSGCGKSTVLRSMNRMNDLVPTARLAGTI